MILNATKKYFISITVYYKKILHLFYKEKVTRIHLFSKSFNPAKSCILQSILTPNRNRCFHSIGEKTNIVKLFCFHIQQNSLFWKL